MPSVLDGKYELIRAAGSGGTANVYLAKAAADGRQVAIKVLKKALSQQEDMLGRFEREAKVLQRISNPHVVKLIELAPAPEGLLLVMEWAQGERMDTIELEPAEVKPVLLQLASALGAIHAAGVVHRDFKPENVIIDRAAPGGVHCWLLDLGIARFRKRNEGAGGFVTMAGKAAGTPSFVSPEQLQGEPPDPRSDIYSFGVVAYRVLSGALPITGANDFEVMQNHVRKVPALCIPKDPSLQPLVPVVMKCLEKKRGDRPADGHALRAQLEGQMPKWQFWKR